MRLEAVDGTAADVLPRLHAMLEGSGPALGLGTTRDATTTVADGTAAVITTSGSTGIPKRVVLSRAALIASGTATATRVGAGPWLLALPPGYVAGLQVLSRSLLAGHEPVLLDGSFRPEAFAAAALAMPAGGLYTSLVPAQLTRLLDAAEHDDAVAAALRVFAAILVGGQALPALVRRRAQDAGARIVRTYGATETCGGCVYDGVPLDGVTIRVAAGEVQLSGPVLADGYLDDAALTDAAFPRDADGTRWYRTGDAGAVDAGVLRVHGRIDNVIISGGINISLDRVERVVRDVAGLAGAVVVGVPDGRWGEASVIVVARGAVAPDADPRAAPRDTEADLLEAARRAVADQIGPHARPARLVFVDEMATLHSGKPDRAAIARAVTR
ncbi:o-succinylbenzoate--CoA ligase [Microbacterium kribbense]|uniref:O-succinylbenzoate--CoA ligase n=1 Tax=Microbacterium kribbense TaxID=433645 RepID=A0ABP7GNM5_9MICO